jgi:hypothetical protein
VLGTGVLSQPVVRVVHVVEDDVRWKLNVLGPKRQTEPDIHTRARIAAIGLCDAVSCGKLTLQQRNEVVAEIA